MPLACSMSIRNGSLRKKQHILNIYMHIYIYNYTYTLHTSLSLSLFPTGFEAARSLLLPAIVTTAALATIVITITITNISY